MKKLLIILILIGCKSPEVKKESVNYNDSAIIYMKDANSVIKSEHNQVDKFIEWNTAYMIYRQRATEYEIKYLRTKNDKYRIQGNLAYDSARKYAIVINKLIKEIRNETR